MKPAEIAAQFHLSPEEQLRFSDTAKVLATATVDALDEAARRTVAEATLASQLPAALGLLITHLREEKLAALLPPAERVTDDGPHASTRAMIAELTAAGSKDLAERLQAGLDEVLAAEKEAHPQQEEDQP